MTDDSKLSPVEGIKIKSRGLRGDLVEDIENQLTGAVTNDNQQLIKFHGSYMQDDRDRREERERKKLEPAYSFMIRLRIPAGDINAEQWIGIQEVADRYASGIVKITTRQTVQLHGVVKAYMKPTMQWFDKLGLDSIAACGDVNRNVVAGSNPAFAKFHHEVFEFADKISEHLLPRTGAFKEIWLDGEKLEDGEPAERDPLYGEIYLPRKFKIGIAIPPHNDTDVLTQDIGLIAIEEEGQFVGFNVAIGGGLGTTHGNANTYPRLGNIIGFVSKEQTLDTVWQIAAVQRDWGNREDRKQARLKYTLDRVGVGTFKTELEKRLGFTLLKAKEFKFTHRGDEFDWAKDVDGKWYYTLFVENGRVMDMEDNPIRTALMAIAKTGKAGFRFTANQNVILTRISDADKPEIEALIRQYGLEAKQRTTTRTRKEAMACVALPTCSLALAEAQRYMPDLLTKVEALLEKHGLANERITIRMTGCPNGCARPYAAEIGLVGKSAGKYNIMIGGDVAGYRLNTLYKEEADENMILQTIDEMFVAFKQHRNRGEIFGDFSRRYFLKETVTSA